MSSQGQRELVYCHQCKNEWYRDDHGLVCSSPTCGSEFVEVIEPGHDPRESEDSDDDIRHFHPFQHLHTSSGPFPSDPHNAPDPDEGDVGHFHVRSGPGSFTYTYYSSSSRGLSPRPTGSGADSPQGGPEAEVMNHFGTMLQGIMGANAGRPGAFSPTPQGNRFHYSSTARLYPRDPNNPQPNTQPVDDLSNILNTLFTSIQNPQTHRAPGQQPNQMPINPIAGLMSMLLAPNARPGDVAHSQEQFDRIISQLMEQNATGNAPPPAEQSDIASLPKRKIDSSMLDDKTGKAECTICMDEVAVGDEVTMLWCDHWFHGGCVEAWLREHDTCPHCRKSVKEGKEAAMAKQQQRSASGTGSGSGSGGSSSRRRSSSGRGSPGGSGSGGSIRDTFRNIFSGGRSGSS